MLSDGLGNKEIAGQLGISGHTAKFHVAQILAKLGAPKSCGIRAHWNPPQPRADLGNTDPQRPDGRCGGSRLVSCVVGSKFHN